LIVVLKVTVANAKKNNNPFNLNQKYVRKADRLITTNKTSTNLLKRNK
jgi:hypothetical protein